MSYNSEVGEYFLDQAHYSTGRVAASFTSTAMEPQTQHEAGSLPFAQYFYVNSCVM
jgi:hypothetical protein